MDYDKAKIIVKEFLKLTGVKKKEILERKDIIELKNFLIDEYKEYGFKLLARKLDSTYSKIRGVFITLNIERRTGRNIVTDNVKKIRSEKALKEHENQIGWWDPKVIRKNTGKKRGMQGYYHNKSIDKDVYLRSSYEYIFAKWLDNHNIKWDVEVRSYNVGKEKRCYYRPDFFIYDKENNLELIVEIKGYWKDKVWKVKSLQKIIPIPVVLIDNMNPYIKTDFKTELNEWESLRLKEQKSNQ